MGKEETSEKTQVVPSIVVEEGEISECQSQKITERKASGITAGDKIIAKNGSRRARMTKGVKWGTWSDQRDDTSNNQATFE